MTELITRCDGHRSRRRAGRPGAAHRRPPRVILATGGFDHDLAWRRECPSSKRTGFRQPRGDGRRDPGGEKVGAGTDPRRGVVVPRHVLAGWPAAVHAQRADDAVAVRGQRRRCPIRQRGRAAHGFRARDDRRSAHGRDAHPVLADHRHAVLPPLRRRRTPADPEDPVRTGADGREAAQGLAGVRHRLGRPTAGRRSAAQIGVPADALRRTATRFNELPAPATTTTSTEETAPTTTTTATRPCPTRTCTLISRPPYLAFQIILGDLGTSGGLRTDEHARVLRR